MKKILLMAAFAVATLSANAQVWVGGALGFNYENEKDVEKVTSFNIAPEVGYNLDENWAIALSLDFGYANHKPEVLDSYGVTTFTVAPYVRYTFARAGVANFFLDGGFGIGTRKVEGNDATTTNANNKKILTEVPEGYATVKYLRTKYGISDKFLYAHEFKQRLTGLETVTVEISCHQRICYRIEDLIKSFVAVFPEQAAGKIMLT